MLNLVGKNKNYKQYEDYENGYMVEIEFENEEITTINGTVYADYSIEFLKRKKGTFKIIQHKNISNLLSTWEARKLIDSYDKALLCIEKLKRELNICRYFFF